MKILNQRQLPKDRLATIDASGGRVYVLPAEVKGFFHTWRWRVRLVLLLIFLLLPWIKLGGAQLVLMDLPGRRFAFFGLTFWAHDAPLLFFVLLILVTSLATATAIGGRVWCGWACPQTVFIEAIYRPLERLILGSHLSQRQFYAAPLSINKVIRLLAKWGLFFVVSFIIGHTFLAYFVGGEKVVAMILESPFANWTNFLVASFATTLVMFDFGWFREQFCIIMCPYGRFQSVLVGRNSYNVMYDSARGEPRKGLSPQSQGDCIDCYKCVNVCPTGIDIRNGTQMECIACTACLDACDEVMVKIKKPMGLIRYASINSLLGKQAPWLQSRTLFYLLFLTLATVGLATAIGVRKPLRLEVLRGTDLPYQVLHEATQDLIINHFKVHAQNDEIMEITAVPVPADPRVTVVIPTNRLVLAPGQNTTVHFFVKFPAEMVMQTGELDMGLQWIQHRKSKILSTHILKLLGPKM